MTALQATSERGFGVSLAVSGLIHLLVFLALFWWNWLAPASLVKQETYYVDIVNLPVAAPRAGTPAQQTEAPVPPSSEQQMALPAPKKPEPASKQMKTPKSTDKAKPAAEAESFAEKMARLEGKVESREGEAKLEQLRRKVAASSGKPGMPGAKGTEAGSDYAAYIQSRLKDAFRSTIFYTSKNPEVVVRVFIDIDGKISRKKTERSSGDRAFELSALRAIDLASQKFTPPPDRKVYEGVFVFRPQGISNSKP
jgi:colicin import membrane protein